MLDPVAYAGGRQAPAPAREGGGRRPALRAIGAGLPRTGNMSLRLALGRLLGGACYQVLLYMRYYRMMHPPQKNLHPDAAQMTDVHAGDAAEWRFWLRRLRGLAAAREEWEDFLEARGYVAAIDFPAALFYR